jgi:putative flippase GtrA
MIRHRARLIIFGVIGAFVFTLQFVLQTVLVQVWQVGPVPSYIAVVVFCVQVSFLLNRRFTWGDRQIPSRVAWYRFNSQKAVTTAVNLAVYAGIVKLGENYHLANVLTAGFFTLVNYALGNSWAFASSSAQDGGYRRS